MSIVLNFVSSKKRAKILGFGCVQKYPLKIPIYAAFARLAIIP
jgi:hypothetical protein